jgi:hypothetical protein
LSGLHDALRLRTGGGIVWQSVAGHCANGVVADTIETVSPPAQRLFFR